MLVKDDSEQLTFSLEAYSALGEIDKILASFIGSTLKRYGNTKTIHHILKTMVTDQGTRKVRTLEQIKKILAESSINIEQFKLESILK